MPLAWAIASEASADLEDAVSAWAIAALSDDGALANIAKAAAKPIIMPMSTRLTRKILLENSFFVRDMESTSGTSDDDERPFGRSYY